jgi:SAM-dependent methyltransferase
VRDVDECLRGEKLYGDDFAQTQIDAWFADEAEGYYNLARPPRSAQREYHYWALNDWHGFSKLPPRRYEHVVGIGAAFGAELRPVLSASRLVTILEPSDGFAMADIDGVPVRYVKPNSSGVMPFQDASVDLITCFGVLHHIPNVSKVLSEFRRVLAPNGYALVREPTASMGDWRFPRPGLTKHERGIPAALFREAIEATGLSIVSERKCVFSLTPRLQFLTRKGVFNNKLLTALDWAVCALPIWSHAYHPTSPLQKLRPTSVFYVLRKA